MTVKVLDCTIRDGGHLNSWNFSPEFVRSAYFAACKSGADYFETGYRFHNPAKSFGKFAICDDRYLSQIFDIKNDCKLTVMIDTGKSNTKDFCECKPEYTPIQTVRVAAYPYELLEAFKQCEELKEKNYEVILNLMAISEYNDEHFNKLKNWNNKNILSAVSFADSFGSFVPDDIEVVVDKLKNAGCNHLGFHSHNNLQMAFANALKAMECCVEIIDASAFGMGRGAGNLPIEILTGYLEKKGSKKYNPVSYLDFIDRYILPEISKTPWGYSIPTLISGIKNVHPYYVKDLFNKHLYTINEVWNASGLVKKECPVSFNKEHMETILSEKFVNYDDVKIINKIPLTPEPDAFLQGKPVFYNKHAGRNFLIIANGSSISKYKEKINHFIKEKDCIVIGTNFLDNLYTPDYHCFVNRKRFLKYGSTIGKNSTLLLPSFAGIAIIDKIGNLKNTVAYFDAEVTDDKNSPVFNGFCHNYLGLNVAISAIYCALQMGAKEIFAAGMDGFGENAELMEYFYKEADSIDDKKMLVNAYETLSEDLQRINRYMESKSIPFSIITPTSHTNYYKNIIGVD